MEVLNFGLKCETLPTKDTMNNNFVKFNITERTYPESALGGRKTRPAPLAANHSPLAALAPLIPSSEGRPSERTCEGAQRETESVTVLPDQKIVILIANAGIRTCRNSLKTNGGGQL